MTSFPFKSLPSSVASDTEVDNDGLVGIDSALGVTLGTNTAWYFDHSRLWDIPNRTGVRGSWYRIPRGPWDHDNHDTVKFNAKLGRYLRQNLIDRAGPAVDTGAISRWSRSTQQFNDSTPKIVVLIHGKTPKPGQVPLLAINPSGDPKVGEYNHFFGYWGYDFVAALLGTRNVRTLSGRAIGRNDWTTSFHNPRRTLSKSDHFLVGAQRRQGSDLHVMITYRDGSKSLIEQTSDAIRQISGLYEAQFSQRQTKPHIILLGHSMGGLVARSLLTKPDIAHNGDTLTTDDRKKAGALTDNTLYLITVSSPHEGSALADKVCNIGNNFQLTDTWLDNLYPDIPHIDPVQWAPYVTDRMNSSQASTQDLQTLVWRNFNQGAMAPHLAARSDNSLVPVYCLGSRSPGGPYFHNPNTILGGINPAQITSDRDQYNAIGQVIFDGIVTKIPGSPNSWGTPHPDAKGLDLVRRTTQQELAPLHLTAARAGLSLLGETHSIVGVGTLAADVILRLMTNVPYYLNHQWEILGPHDMIRELLDQGKNATEILAYLLDSYTDEFADAAVWMLETGIDFVEIVKALVSEQVDTYTAIAVMLRDRMNRGLTEIANAFRSAGLSSYNIVMLLATVFHASASSIATILLDWGRSARQTLVRLKPYFDVITVVQALRSVYQISVVTAAQLLMRYWGQTIQQISNNLRQIGYGLSEIAEAMVTVGASYLQAANFLVRDNGWSALDAARKLRDLGAPCEDVIQILYEEFHRPITEVAGHLDVDWQKDPREAGRLLSNAGYTLDKVVDVLKSVFGVSAKTVMQFLKNDKNQSWTQAAKLMRDAGYSAAAIADRLKKDFGRSPVSIVSELKDLFALNIDAAKDLLIGLAVSPWEAVQIVNDLFGP